MSLSTETIRDMFNFVLKYPKSFLFSIILGVLTFLGVFIMVGGALVSLGPALSSVVQSSSFPGFSSFVLTNLTEVAKAAVFVLIGFVVIIIANLLRVGGFPLLVYQAARKRKIDFASIFQMTFRKLAKIFLASLLVGLVIAIPLLPAISLLFESLSNLPASFSLSSFGISLIVLIVCGLISVFLGIKFWLTFPILMLENKGVIDSLKASWKRTEGHLSSILGVLILYALLVSLPLGIIDGLLKLDGYIVYLIWSLIESVISVTLGGVLPVIYYFNSRSMRRR